MLLRPHIGPWIAAVTLALALLAPAEALAGDIVHTVQKGQNLGMIARRYHTTAKAIEARNGLKKGQKIHPGDKLRIVEVEEHARWRRHVERNKTPKRSRKRDRKRAEKKEKKKTTAAATKASSPRHTTRKGKRSVGKHRVARRVAKSAKRPSKPLDPYQRKPRRPGWVQIVRHGEKFRGTLVASNGGVIAKSSKRLDRLLRSRRTGKRHRIDRRLLKLLTDVSDHFGSRTIIVVSGYRPYSPKQYTRNSRHNHGAAIDFRIVGVPNHALFAYCKRFRSVGCGLYPNSHFVHMDVRKHKTQWVDYSLPGQRPIYARKHKRREQARARRKARARTQIARKERRVAEPAKADPKPIAAQQPGEQPDQPAQPSSPSQ